jgi:hypothetical protein
LIIVTRLVDHDERVQPVDALECRLIGVGGFADMGLASSLPASPMYHSSSSVIRPANDPFDAPDRYIAKDYMDLFRRGAVVVAKGSRWVSSHHETMWEAPWLLPVSCDDVTAVVATLSAISRCLDHMNSPSRSRTQPTGSRTYGFSGG